jgi:NitT/TauT family transport system substrate-binding protein
MLRRFVLAAAACALFAAPLAARADDALTVMSGAGAPGIFDIMDLVAAGAGFLKAEHLDVNKQYVSGPGTAAQLVAAGKADIAAISVEPVILGYEKGLRLQFFFARGARYSYVLGVLADSPIKQLSDFKGASLGETAPNTADVAAKSMLGGVGLHPGDYSFVTIGIGAGAISSVLAKRVDGVAVPYLEIANAEAVGVHYRVFRHPTLSDVVNTGFAAAPSTIANRPDVLRRFSRAMAEAAVFLRANPAAAAKLYLQGSGQGLTPEALARVTRIVSFDEGDFPAANPASHTVGLISPRKIQLLSSYMADYGVISAPVPGAAIATSQFIPYANDFDHKAIEKLAKAWH